MTTPFLTPSVRKLLDVVAAGPATGPEPAAQRAALDGAMAQLGWPAGKPADRVIDTSGVGTHIFLPEVSDPPLIVYIHGGSFVAGGIPAHLPVARALADASGCAVALIDYRRAPEYRSPAALDDCLAAIAALRADAAFADRHFALLGDSAGGALAAACALALDTCGRPVVLVLINPMTSPRAEHGSLDAFATGYFASADDFRLGWDFYDAPGAPLDLLAEFDLSGLPPLLLFSNEADPVRDQGETLAEQASAAGVPTAIFRMRGLVHAAWLFAKALPEAALIMDVVGGAIQARLRRG